MVTVTETTIKTEISMLDPLRTYLSGSVDGSMIAIHELSQTNAQISEHNQVS